MAGKARLSYSRLSMFERCGEQYRRRYIENEVVPPGIAMFQGTAVHAAAELNYREKIQTGEDCHESDVCEIAVATFEEAARVGGIVLTAEEETVGAAKVLGEAKDRVARATAAWRREIAPHVQPVAVEDETVLDFGAVELVTRTDVVTADAIRDLKISARYLNAEDSQQLTVYAMGHYIAHGEMPAVVIDQVNPKNARTKIHTSTRSEEDFAAVQARLNAMFAAMSAGMFLPASAESWCCCDRFCGYWRTCRYAARTRRIAWED